MASSQGPRLTRLDQRLGTAEHHSEGEDEHSARSRDLRDGVRPGGPARGRGGAGRNEGHTHSCGQEATRPCAPIMGSRAPKLASTRALARPLVGRNAELGELASFLATLRRSESPTPRRRRGGGYEDGAPRGPDRGAADRQGKIADGFQRAMELLSELPAMAWQAARRSSGDRP